MRYFYNLLFYILLPFIFLRLLWRARPAPAYRQRWRERLGLVKPIAEATIWIHAVSLGEAKLAIILLQSLRAHLSNYHFVITSMTVTGSNLIQANLGERVTHYYVPYDYPAAVKRFLKRIHPSMLIILETELWPNILYYCGKQKIPIVISNARLGKKSSGNYAKARWMLEPILKNISLVLAQTNDDAARFASIGIAPTKIKISDNLKFDIAPPENLIQQGHLLREQIKSRPVLIAASTHRGEDEIILQAFALMQASIPEVLLILVPRHPERFNEVATLCQQQGYAIARRSQNQSIMDTPIYLGDTMGELWSLYACADIAFVGGSLIAQGGHNLLEPAALSLPVITGPHLFNFQQIADRLAENDALMIIHNANELAKAALNLMHHSALKIAKGHAALAVVNQNQGALAQQVQAILQLLPSKK